MNGLFGSLGSNLQDPAYRERLALAFNTMRLAPDANLASAIQQRQAARETAATRNRTVEFLRQRGRADLADAVQSGAIDAKTAAAQLFAQPKAVAPMSTIGKLADDLRAGRITKEEYDLAVANMAPQGMTIESTPGGGFRFVQGTGAAAKPLTEQQSKDVVYSTRAEGALNVLEGQSSAGRPIAETLTSAAQRAANIDPTGLVRGAVQSPEFQVAQQAGQEFLQAILRKDTGAAITTQEQELYGTTFLPQPGDSPEVLEVKKQSRRRAIDAINAGLPPSAIVAREQALQREQIQKKQEEPQPSVNRGVGVPDFSKMSDAELDAYIAERQRLGGM